MEIMTVVLLSGAALVGPRGQGSWNFTATSSGENFSWTSPTSVDPSGGDYEMLYTVTGAQALVSYIGIEFGPYDAMDMIPEDAIETWRASQGPAPLDFGWITVVSDDQEPPSLKYDWIVEIDAKGYVTYKMENIFLGEIEYNLGYPWGWVTVQIESGSIQGNLSIQSVINPCYEDINGDSMVDVIDLLEVIGNWGYCLNCPADINRDDVIDVTDLLDLVGSWGPCP
ncbi:MAG: hypothetical protein H8E83_03320 [Planctomycetes bacterium]|nr:hypothetical protein [Planctomycetota bacterium]